MDALSHFFLFFTNWPFILCFLILGLILDSRARFYHATCIMLISIIINVALKMTFQVPLSPALHKVGFAFPSGHMQLATVLYGWLGLHIQNRSLQSLILVLLTGIGFGLVHFGYHTWFDVWGAVFFAGLILSFYQILSYQKTPLLPWITASIATLAMLYITYQNTIPMYAWIAYGSLLSFIMMVPKKIWAHNPA